MKPHTRVIYILLATLLITILLAPFLKLAADYGVRHSAAVQDQLRYGKHQVPGEPKTYEFAKVVRRTLMIVVVVLFFWQRRRLRIGPLALSAFRDPRAGRRRFLLGLGIGIVSLLIYVVVQWLAEARAVRLNLVGGVPVVTGKFLKYTVSSLAVGIAEELLFRGFILQAFAEGLSTGGAVWLSSFLYSILHFFRGSYYVVPDGSLDLMIGFKVLGEFSRGIFSRRILHELPEVIGLLLTGVVLAVAFVRTGNLYMSIGLHAGWVFVLKASKLFLSRKVEPEVQWFYGQSGGAGGVLSWIMLIAILLVIMRLYPRRSADLAASSGDG